MMLPPTAKRVEKNTYQRTANRITNHTLLRIEQALQKEQLDQELDRLRFEWDTERVLETNAACLLLVSLGLGTMVDRRFLWLTGGVAAFLLQHALQGWCPPLPVIRALGIRTAGEINAERTAIKALRGDFAQIGQTASQALQAAQLE